MSGGSYDYVFGRIGDAAETLRVRHPFAAHVIALADHLDRIAKVMQDIEWADSGDTSWTPELDAAIRSVLPGPAELAVSIEIAERASNSLRIALDAARASGGKPS